MCFQRPPEIGNNHARMYEYRPWMDGLGYSVTVIATGHKMYK